MYLNSSHCSSYEDDLCSSSWKSFLKLPSMLCVYEEKIRFEFLTFEFQATIAQHLYEILFHILRKNLKIMFACDLSVKSFKWLHPNSRWKKRKERSKAWKDCMLFVHKPCRGRLIWHCMFHHSTFKLLKTAGDEYIKKRTLGSMRLHYANRCSEAIELQIQPPIYSKRFLQICDEHSRTPDTLAAISHLRFVKAQQIEREQNYRNFLLTDEQDLVSNTDEEDCPICFSTLEPGEGVVLRECLHTFCRCEAIHCWLCSSANTMISYIFCTLAKFFFIFFFF